MAKKPEVSDITKKLDLGGIVGSIKSLINPTGVTPDVDPDDAIGVKIGQISVLAQQLTKAAAEQAQELTKLNQLLNGLYQDIERLRHPTEAAGEASNPTEAQAKSAVSESEVSKTETPKAEASKPEPAASAAAPKVEKPAAPAEAEKPAAKSDDKTESDK